ncbi:hypothetical protein [Rhodococcus sp. MEB041]|uniref:hypothetical protein n=1 Tax=Rhodococcus sp. MEB041 TaxID=3040323 RepID=UPI00254B0E04|nr:hypothetical protein [Rhodococcus sp. MEB041]
MNRAEIISHLIETITEAGYDYHDYSLAATASRITTSHQDSIEMGEAQEGAPVSLPDAGTVWEWLNEAAHREGAPDLLHLAA